MHFYAFNLLDMWVVSIRKIRLMENFKSSKYEKLLGSNKAETIQGLEHGGLCYRLQP